MPRAREPLARRLGWGVVVAATFGAGCNEARVLSLGRSVDSADDGGASGAAASGGSAGSGATAGSGGGGSPEMLRYVFTNVTRRTELCTDGDNDNPTLTADAREIYFSTDRDESDSEEDVWVARRAQVGQPFSDPEPVASVNTDLRENSPAVSADGQRLYLSSDREGGLGEQDIWVATRAGAVGEWSAPVPVAELNSTADDIPRPPGQGGLVMPIGSRRDDDQNYYTYFAERPNGGAPFAAPMLVSELVTEGYDTIDAFLTADGLTVFYNLATDEYNGNLYVSVRTAIAEPFSRPIPLGVNTLEGDERDPWLSADGRSFFFSYDEDGEGGVARCIYEATVTREP